MASAQGRRMTLDDLGAIASVGSPLFTPDGRAILISVGRPNYETNRRETEWLLIDAASGIGRSVSLGATGAGSPAWSGNGRIAFLAPASQAPNVTAQLWVADSLGGPARVVTDAPKGVLDFAWSPDGTSLAYLTADPPSARTGPDRYNDGFVVGNDPYLMAAEPARVHLWVTEAAGGSPRRLTSGSWSLATSLNQSPIAWSPDGTTIALQRFESAHSGDTDKSTILLVDVVTGATRPLTGSRWREDDPAFSPDGRWIAFYSPRDGKPANLRDVHLVAASWGAGRNVSRHLDRAVRARWTPSGDLLLVGPDGTRAAAWVLNAATGMTRRLPLGDVTDVAGVAISTTGTIAFVGTERNRPDELMVLEEGAPAPRRLTHLNDAIADLSLGRTERMKWTSPDGQTPDGVVTYPPDFARGQRYPLVLLVHGGPTASSLEGFAARAQLFAAQGWIVLQPNYRGSDNLGNAFQAAIATNPGDGIGADVIGGVRALIRRGIVDTTRMAVSGWSFGGYVSAWMLGHYNVWRAAVVGAAATDFFDMYALTDLNVQLRHALAQSPYTGGREAYFRAQSPLTYATRIRAPTLILHDVYDQRVVIGQSYKLFHALKDNGVPTEFVAYPIAAHSPSDPVRSRDVSRRWIDWISRQFGQVQ
jgi:dipeptidyl aminopeptidase/acylaminoacyl peptidase